MSGLSERHKVMGEKLFEMESGYVNILVLHENIHLMSSSQKDLF